MLLEVKNLTTKFTIGEKTFCALNSVSFNLKKGETLGIVGESGCGKSVMALSLLRLIPSPPGMVSADSVKLSCDDVDVDLMRLSELQMRKIRGGKISMIFQDPMVSLDPVYTIGHQISEAIRAHLRMNKNEAEHKALELLKLVGMPAAGQRIKDYPNQLSGGMCQRVMIASALSCGPDLLIADEPTTSLDVTVQAQILDLISKLREETGMSIIMITHDFGVVADLCERVIVMYAGRFLEEGTVEQIFSAPKHPYTQALLKSILPIKRSKEWKRLPTIPGRVPELWNISRGCVFKDRCERAKERCRLEDVPDDPCNVGRLVRCFYV